MDKKILQEKLKKEHISQRDGGKVKLSYIESHHAIREANRAFDFDGWSYNITETKQIQDEKKTNKWGKELYYIGYTAQVVVKVGDVIREDVGFGQGIDADLGKAHEGAIKEAVSDAQKRALRTFGDIFGLALYDKTQANVEDTEKAPSNDRGQSVPTKKKSNGKDSNKTTKSKADECAFTPESVKIALELELNKKLTTENMKTIFNLAKENGIHLINDFEDKEKEIVEIAKKVS